MRKLSSYAFMVTGLLLLSACFNPGKKTSWSVSLGKGDKKPYGCFLAYQSLGYFFPGAKITDLSRGFRYSSIDEQMIYSKQGKSLMIMVGLDFYLSDGELQKLSAFAAEGNELVIFARAFDGKLEEWLGHSLDGNGQEEVPLGPDNTGKASLHSLTIPGNEQTFGYQGRSILAYFSKAAARTHQDTAEQDGSQKYMEEIDTPPDTLGLAKGRPDFLRYQVGQGHITLHAAPLVLSNYFLLQRDNVAYLAYLWSTIPGKISRIYWNDYYKRSTKASDLGVLLRYPATRWAFIIAAATLLVYLMFESKRRQRIIREVPPLENASVSFVETVGRLYFNKGDHTNLAEKMIQHFLEWVRTHYFIGTNVLDEQFVKQLIQKSGLPEAQIRSMMEMIHNIHTSHTGVEDHDLYHLHQTFQLFYKNYKN